MTDNVRQIPSVTKKNKVTVVGLLLLNFTTSEHAKQAQDRFHEEGAELYVIRIIPYFRTLLRAFTRLDGSDRILVYSFQHHSATYDFCEIDANGKFYLQVWFAKKNKPKKIFIIKGKVMDPTP